VEKAQVMKPSHTIDTSPVLDLYPAFL